MIVEILIITPIPSEYLAVRKHLDSLRTIVDEKYQIGYEVGKFKTKFGWQQIAIVQKGKGGIETALSTERAIQFLQPSIVLLVGTAATLKPDKISLGAVIIGKKGYYYEGGRETDKQLLSFPKISQASARLVELAKAVDRKGRWTKRLNNNLQPEVHFGPIVSGEKVIQTISSKTYHHIKEQYNDALGLEMEAYAFLETVSHYPSIEGLIIRSVSDQLFDKQEANKKGSRSDASTIAAAFAFELLFQLPIKRKSSHIFFAVGSVLLVIFFLLANNFPNSTPRSHATFIDSIKHHQPKATIPEIEPIEKAKKIDITTSPKQQTFSTNLLLDRMLLNNIKSQLKASHQQKNATYEIVFKHTGILEKNDLANDLYYYSGGQLQVVINGVLCCCSDQPNFQIPASMFPGNPLAVEESNIEKAKITIIRQQILPIVNAIKKCL